ncbi:MAG: peroxiredoxin-like family protein [Crocinitomicaceae bacterium]
MQKFISLLSILFALLSSATAQDQMFDICPMKVGENIPDSIMVTDVSGTPILFGDAIKKDKAIIVFYRGGWCPYCTRHLSALGQMKEEIEELGYTLYGITPDQFDSLGVSQVRSQSDYKIFSDSKVELITAFGLGWEVDDKNYVKYRDQYGMDTEEWSGETHHVLPVPAVYIIEDGVVQFNYVNPNYSVRLKPETLLAILKSY